MEFTISILQALISIVIILTFWLIQSIIILHTTRKYILPILFKNKFLEWVIVQPSVAIHEISHLFAAVFTGSFVSESFISSRAGRVTALSSESIGGWISRIIAAFAPTFQTFLLLVIILLVFPYTIPRDFITSIFEYKENHEEIINGILLTLETFYAVILNVFQSLTLTSSIALIFIFYFLIVLSITATPSEEDWKAGLQVILSPVPFFSIVYGFVSIYVAFSYFGIGFLVPIVSVLIINFIIALFGIFISILFSKALEFLFILILFRKF
jgi:hypothetical protein